MYGLFTTDGGLGSLDAKDYQWIDMEILILCDYVDKYTGYIEGTKLTKGDHGILWAHGWIVFQKLKTEKVFKAWILLLKRRVTKLKDKMVCLFENHSESGLFKMKFYVLDTLFHQLEKLCEIQVLIAALLNISTLYLYERIVDPQ